MSEDRASRGSRRPGYRDSLSDIIRRMDLPLGFALSIWSGGAIAEQRYGDTTGGFAVLYIVGSLAAYLTLAAWAVPRQSASGVRATTGQPVVNDRAVALLNGLSIVAALAVTGLTLVVRNPTIGFALAGFVGTMTYQLGVGTALYFGRAVGSRRSRARARDGGRPQVDGGPGGQGEGENGAGSGSQTDGGE